MCLIRKMLNVISEPCAGYEHEICGGAEPPYPGPSPEPWEPWWPSPTPPVDPDHDICAELNPCVQGEYIALFKLRGHLSYPRFHYVHASDNLFCHLA